MLAATLVLLGLPSAAQGALLTVNLAGVDLQFDGSIPSIFDSGNMALGAADPVDAATFKDEVATIDDWMAPGDDIRADLLIEDSVASVAPNAAPAALPLAGGMNRFIWTVDDGTNLQLDFVSLTVSRNVIPGLEEIFLMTGAATVTGQNLPGGMQFAGPVGIAYVSTQAMFVNNGQQGLAVTGVLTITGEMSQIPEPTSFALAGLGLLAIVSGRRRRSHKRTDRV